MRNAFIRALTEVAARDDCIYFITADLGYKIFDDFARRFPKRFMNIGVAEATMAGVAAGLALEGYRPFVYSIVPFATLRCYEQIRNDICYHEAPVVIVGVGGGYSYGPNGPTHHALEDIAVMRLLPNMIVVCPGDPLETEAAVRELARHGGPAYLRLGRAGEPVVHSGPVELTVGKSICMKPGTEVTILATGNMLQTAMKAAERLEARASCRVLSVPFVKPLDLDALRDAVSDTKALVTLEEHGTLGGFGSAVAEQLCRLDRHVPMEILGARDRFAHQCGDQEFHREANGLTVEAVERVCLRLLESAR